jgi:hypothetical protein
VVERDSVALDPAEWGTAAPVDPGKHVIRASASGKKAWTGEALAATGANPQITVPALEAESTSSPVPVPARAEAPAPAPTETPQDDGSSQRVIGLVVGGAGVAALAVGAYFGLKASSTHDDALSHCNALKQCDPDGLKLGDDATSQATVSTIAFIAGGVLLASGAALYLLAPRGAARTRGLVITPGLAGISARGTF